jgi:MFS family permease
MIIWAELSDIFGRKLFATMAALISLFSQAHVELPRLSLSCELRSRIVISFANRLNRIIFRALQGLGGSGIYAVDMAIFFELVPPEEFPKYISIVSAVYAVSLLLGPILGGLINDAGA